MDDIPVPTHATGRGLDLQPVEEAAALPLFARAVPKIAAARRGIAAPRALRIRLVRRQNAARGWPALKPGSETA